MPFAGYADFDACVRDNSDKSDPEAYCAAIKRQVEQQEIDAQDTTQVFEDVDSCEVAMDEAGLDNPREVCEQLFSDPQLSEPLFVSLADTRQPGPIERVEEGDQVRYKNLKLLGTGVWGDSGTQSHFLYSERTIEALADNVVGTTANLFHEQENEVAEVGELDPDSVFVGQTDSGLYGDLVLDLENAASQFADEALLNALETEGRQGLKGPSLEIKNPEYEFDFDSGVMEVVDGEIHGIALVGLGVSAGPGSRDVAIDRQTAERAVALADAGDPTIITLQDHALTMDTETIREQLQNHDIEVGDDVADETLHALADALLQEDGEMAMVQDLIEQARQEGFDLGDQSAEELRQFIAENLDPSDDAMAAFEDVAAAYLEATEADSLEVTPAEGLLDFIAEQGGADGDDDGDDNSGHEDEPPEEPPEMEARLSDLEDTLSELSETVTMLAEETESFREADTTLSDLSERLESLPGEETVSELDERLTQLEQSLEDPKSLADIAGAGASADEDDDRVILSDWNGPRRSPDGSFGIRHR